MLPQAVSCPLVSCSSCGKSRKRFPATLIITWKWMQLCVLSRSQKDKERARLVVKNKLRYAASRLIGALRFARGFKKAPITHKGFEPKFPHFWNLKLEYFPIEKFSRKTAKWGIFSYYKLIMSQVSRYLRTKNTPDFETWSWIFFHLEFFPHFFSKKDHIILLCAKFQKDQRNFFGREVGR